MACRRIKAPGHAADGFRDDMKNFLRDLAFLGLFAAAVAGIVMVVLVHQGRFSLPPDEGDAAPATRAAAVVVPPIPTARESVTAPAPQEERFAPLPTVSARAAAVAVADADAGSRFDPATRGVLGDARILCLPEVAWLQEQLSRWAADGRGPRRLPPRTLDAAHAAARRASAFAYEVSPECWNDPATLDARGWGDCADKSLWLARELLRAGYPMVGIRLGVPEDYEPGEPGHAWVVLYHHGSEWIYDPAAGPRLTSQDAGPAKRFRVTATVFPR